MAMLDAVVIAAIREEYNAATPAANRSDVGYWRFAAEFLANAYWENDDDGYFDCCHSIVEKHAAAILAHNPNLAADDEELFDLYFADWDLED